MCNATGQAALRQPWVYCSRAYTAEHLPSASDAQCSQSVAAHHLQIIAREVVNSNKAITRLHTQKAHMMEMEMALKHQLGAQASTSLVCFDTCSAINHGHFSCRSCTVRLTLHSIVAANVLQAHAIEENLNSVRRAAMVKVAGVLSKSGEVMKSMNQLMKVGAMHEGMQNMAREMMKAGLIEDMVDDAMDDITDAQEEDVDEEVEKVLHEVAGEQVAALPQAGTARVSAQEVAQMTEEVRVLRNGARRCIRKDPAVLSSAFSCRWLWAFVVCCQGLLSRRVMMLHVCICVQRLSCGVALASPLHARQFSLHCCRKRSKRCRCCNN